MLADLIWRKTRRADLSSDPEQQGDSRVAHVDPRVNLVEVSAGPAVGAALVRQQVVQLLERHLEARHVGWLEICLDPFGLGGRVAPGEPGEPLQRGGGLKIQCKINKNKSLNI